MMRRFIDMYYLSKWLFRLCLCVWVGTYFLSGRLPTVEKINPALYTEPLQWPTAARPFEISYQGETTTVQHVAEYAIRGVVVSHNDPALWYRFDITHDNKSIDTRDLCVIWGNNLKSNDYTKLSYRKEDYYCSYRWSDGSPQFNPTQFSNNHLITDSPVIRQKIAQVSVGDEIFIKGKLVNYSEQRWGNGRFRNTSTTRTDTEMGACEVIFVEDLQIIASHNALINQLHTWSFYIVVATLILMCIL